MAIYPSVKFCVSPRSVPLCFIMCDRVRENRPQVGKIDIGLRRLERKVMAKLRSFAHSEQ